MNLENKIKTIEIENFMSIGHGTLEFDESNIVTLCGYNDSGKSAITRLMEVMFYNKYPNDQSKFIKDGKTYWQAIITFSDGLQYIRRKGKRDPSLYEIKKDGELIYTNRLENGKIAAISGIPEEVEQMLGVIRDDVTGETLNVRRNTDTLFLINTSGGDNYKILNSILKSDDLVNATTNLLKDKKEEEKELKETEIKKNLIEENINNTKVLTKTQLENLEEIIANTEQQVEKNEKLENINEKDQNIKAIKVYKKIKPLDNEQVLELSKLIDKQENIKALKINKEIKPIEKDKALAISKISDTHKQIKELRVNKKIKPIDNKALETKITTLGQIVKSKLELKEIKLNKKVDEIKKKPLDKTQELYIIIKKNREIKEYTEELTRIEQERKEMVAKLEAIKEETGWVICPNCNTIITDANAHKH